MNIYSGNLIRSIIMLAILIGSGLSMNPYERLMKREEAPQGLYGPADHVTVLSSTNFNEVIFDRPMASFVEFYNSYCGACQRFSPTWKSLAKNATKWGTFVQVCALDCATDENNDVCRQYEIMRYPTIRYFPPAYSKGAKQLGTNLDHLLIPKPEALMNELVMLLQNETKGGSNWPKFKKFDGDEWNEIFNNIPAIIRFVYVISDELPDTIAQQALLDYSSRDKITTRIVNSNNLKLFNDYTSTSSFRLGAVERKTGKFQSLSIYNDSREAIALAIDEHVRNNHISLLSTEPSQIADPTEDSVGNLLDRFYYDKARSVSPMPLFRADLEQAIKYSLGHEVTQHQVITGEYLSALRSFVSVLTRYYNLGNKASYRKLLDFLMEPSRTEVRGEELHNFINKLNPPIIHTESRYVGCYSTQIGLRRFPCSLWSLFHHLTVQHLDSEYNDDPMEVLHAMHGYIKYFFGCTECSKHFQEMAKRNHIWNVTSKDQAVLWLWSSHNEVNKRLHGDLTEDENHPKIQFPAEEHCHVCHKKNGVKDWDKTEVLEFLRRHYGNDHVSNLGFYDSMPNARMLNARARQIFSGDAHLNIGVLAYVVIIICLMIVAVRFYFRRGYRKKLYPHDILGKV